MSLVHLPPRGIDEPAVTSSALADLVDLARRRVTPAVTVDAETVRRAWAAQRQRRRQRLLVAAAAVVVGVFAASMLPRLDLEHGEHGEQVEQVAVTPPTTTREQDARAREPAPTEREPAIAPIRDEHLVDDGVEPSPVEPDALALADGVQFVADPPEGARYEVMGAWEVRVAAGRYEVAVPIELHSSLRIELGARVLVVDPGGNVLLEVGAEPPVRLLAGSAAWVAADGSRTPLVRAGKPDVDDPGLLARKAEKQMTAGDRSGAIKTLRSLVRKHPSSASTRAAVLDLGRLLRAAGRRDEARCAYRMHLERWPSVMRSEIEAVLRELGDGPACRGLTPKT